MRCPFCGHEETQVKDSRPTEDHAAIRRRRYCPECDQRFTTFERVQLRDLTVVKAGSRKQPFNRDKIIRSMQIALRKRPIDIAQIEEAADHIVRTLETQGEHEIPSDHIGALVMKKLAEMDTIGYIRYASVYKNFNEPTDFNDFLEKVKAIQAGQ